MRQLVKPKRVLFSLALICGVTLGQEATTHASPLLDVARDVLSEGGLQPGTVPGGAAAAFFNPALLVESPQSLAVGFLMLRQDIGITVKSRLGRGFAVSEGASTVKHGVDPNNPARDNLDDQGNRVDEQRTDSAPLPTSLLQQGRLDDPTDPNNQGPFAARPRQGAGSGHKTLPYLGIGMNIHLFDERLAVGFYGIIPASEMTNMKAFFNDEREQYFSNSLHPELYSDRMTAISIALGAGFKILENLSLGAGATIGITTGVMAPVFVRNPSELDELLIDLNAPVTVGVAPHFGVSYLPIERLRITATAHTPTQIELAADFSYALQTEIEQASSLTFVLDYMPWRLGLGSSYKLVDDPVHTVELVGSLEYAAWSSYLDRHGDKPVEAYAWSDTLSPNLGVRWRWNQLTTLADLRFSPTPVPEQTGRSNYVDNDVVAGELGAKYTWEGLFSSNTDFSLGFQLQARALLPRRNTKLETPTASDGHIVDPDLVWDEVPDDAVVGGGTSAAEAGINYKGLQTNNPGWPGFESEGWITGGSIYTSLSF